jgi:hypothetical protein
MEHECPFISRVVNEHKNKLQCIKRCTVLLPTTVKQKAVIIVRVLSGKYPAVLNNSRTGRVSLMKVGSLSEETFLRVREQTLSRGASKSAVRRRCLAFFFYSVTVAFTNILTFYSDFSFEKHQKLQGAESGL